MEPNQGNNPPNGESLEENLLPSGWQQVSPQNRKAEVRATPRVKTGWSPITPAGRKAEEAVATPALTAPKEPVSPTAEGEPRRAEHTVPCGHYMPGRIGQL